MELFAAAGARWLRAVGRGPTRSRARAGTRTRARARARARTRTRARAPTRTPTPTPTLSRRALRPVGRGFVTLPRTRRDRVGAGQGGLCGRPSPNANPNANPNPNPNPNKCGLCGRPNANPNPNPNPNKCGLCGRPSPNSNPNPNPNPNQGGLVDLQSHGGRRAALLLRSRQRSLPRLDG